MASKSHTTHPQPYPRIEDEVKENGCLDDKKLPPHVGKIEKGDLEGLIVNAIKYAHEKSKREAFAILETTDPTALKAHYDKAAEDLFKYFHKYCDDPASTAQNLHNRSYSDVCKETFRNRILQKQRMNSGWRYQSLAKDCALKSGRFKSVSDVGTAEADFNAVIECADVASHQLTLYVSVKNRINTLGGQDWPKAINALEQVAKQDKNRRGPYLCVFGIAMDRGRRTIKQEARSNRAHSVNTEVWLSDFFWPFFSNFTYDEIMSAVLEVLLSKYPTQGKALHITLPSDLIEAFGQHCKNNDLVDESGLFNDPRKAVGFFCKKLPAIKKVTIARTKLKKPKKEM